MFLLGHDDVLKATSNVFVHSLVDNSLHHGHAANLYSWAVMMSIGVATGNVHVSKKSAGQNARRWMTDSCLQNIMTKT
jgi:hypothetical protein